MLLLLLVVWHNICVTLVYVRGLLKEVWSVSQQQCILVCFHLYVCIKKVNCTLVQAPSLCTGCTAYRGSRGIALPCHDHSTRRGWGVSVTSQLIFSPGKDPVSIVQEAGWVTELVWTGAENLAPTGIRSPDRPARSQSLYQLRCLAHMCLCCSSKIVHIGPTTILGQQIL